MTLQEGGSDTGRCVRSAGPFKSPVCMNEQPGLGHKEIKASEEGKQRPSHYRRILECHLTQTRQVIHRGEPSL